MQSWCQYSNTYKFEEIPLTNVNNHTQIDVCSTFNLVYNNVSYINNEDIKIDDSEIQITFNKKDDNRKINNRLYNIDTNTYENIIYNKKQIAIDLLNKLDSYILSINKNIIRNYLVKNITYKLNNRIVEIQVNQNNLLVSLHKVAKQFDVENKLLIRKGYENNSICYYLTVEDDNSLDYTTKIINNMCHFFTTPQESLNDILFNRLKFKIKSLNTSISEHTVNKGLIFKCKRNFALLTKTNYGVYVRLLNVNNSNNVLNVVTRKSYEPLCLSYKVKNEEDINILFPYIKESYEICSINPIDLKYEFYKIYQV